MSEPLELRVTASPELIDAAVRALMSEIGNFHRYDKVGWGWNFCDRAHPGAKFFVRRTGKGLSVVATPAKPKTGNRP